MLQDGLQPPTDSLRALIQKLVQVCVDGLMTELTENELPSCPDLGDLAASWTRDHWMANAYNKVAGPGSGCPGVRACAGKPGTRDRDDPVPGPRTLGAGLGAERRLVANGQHAHTPHAKLHATSSDIFQIPTRQQDARPHHVLHLSRDIANKVHQGSQDPPRLYTIELVLWVVANIVRCVLIVFDINRCTSLSCGRLLVCLFVALFGLFVC